MSPDPSDDFGPNVTESPSPQSIVAKYATACPIGKYPRRQACPSASVPVGKRAHRQACNEAERGAKKKTGPRGPRLKICSESLPASAIGAWRIGPRSVVSAWRTGSCGGLSPCRISCVPPRGCRGSGSRLSSAPGAASARNGSGPWKCRDARRLPGRKARRR